MEFSRQCLYSCWSRETRASRRTAANSVVWRVGGTAQQHNFCTNTCQRRLFFTIDTKQCVSALMALVRAPST